MIEKIPFLNTLVKNYLKNKYEKFPELLSIEITNACNSKCIMCPREKMTRKIQLMPFDVFEKIINDCAGTPLKKINFFWFGDSFCNVKFIDYLKYARPRLPGVKFYVSTNAGLMDKDKSDLILENDLLDVINFDIDGIKKETHEKIRVGVGFDKVMKNVSYFLKRKAELGKKKPQTRVTIIKMSDTASEIDEFKKFWTGRVDKIDVNDFNTWLGTQKDENVGNTLQKSVGGSFKYPCKHPWEELVIGADGRAGLCCLDYDLTAPLGDVMKKTLRQIWNGSEINDYRKKMIELKYNEINCCSRCNAYIYQDNSRWAKLWK